MTGEIVSSRLNNRRKHGLFHAPVPRKSLQAIEDRKADLGKCVMQTTREQHRYEIRIGHVVTGKRVPYKTKSGALRAAERHRKAGAQAMAWEGTLRAWGGISWRGIS